MRNLQKQVKKAFCYQKLFWFFTVGINCSIDLKKISNSQASGPSASDFKSFSWSLEHFFLTVVQNNIGKKIPYLMWKSCLDWLSDLTDSLLYDREQILVYVFALACWVLYFSCIDQYIYYYHDHWWPRRLQPQL